MKYIVLIFLINFSIAQKTLQHSTFAVAKKMELRSLVFAWEVDYENKANTHSSYYIYHSDAGKNFDFTRLVQSENNSILICAFDEDGEINQAIVSKAEDIESFSSEYRVFWLGLNSRESSYAFSQWLIKKTDSERIYGFLNAHGFHEKSFNFFHKRFEKSSSREEQRNLIFWIGSIPSEQAIAFLDKEFLESESDKTKKKIIFAYYQNGLKKAINRLLFIAKHEQDIDLRKKALFWLGQKAGKHIENFFSDLVFSDDEMEIKKSAIFALYNMKNEAALKKVVEKAKDIRLRKKALFWLGQMGVSVDFLESILSQ